MSLALDVSGPWPVAAPFRRWPRRPLRPRPPARDPVATTASGCCACGLPRGGARLPEPKRRRLRLQAPVLESPRTRTDRVHGSRSTGPVTQWRPSWSADLSSNPAPATSRGPSKRALGVYERPAQAVDVRYVPSGENRGRCLELWFAV